MKVIFNGTIVQDIRDWISKDISPDDNELDIWFRGSSLQIGHFSHGFIQLISLRREALGV